MKEDPYHHSLTPEAYRVMREKGTEMPFSGTLLHEKREGSFHCSACGAYLFDSAAKFDSGSGWPSFSQPVNHANVTLIPDRSHGMLRTEVTCTHCGSHLGHVFDDGPPDAGGSRYCINSVCLNFQTKGGI